MPFRKHALVQNAGYHNARGLPPEENDVLAVLRAIKTGSDMIAGAAQQGIVGEIPAALFQLVEATDGLSLAPSAQRVGTDVQQIRLGPGGETRRPHALTPRREIKCLADARERIALGDAAGVALIDGSAQPRKFDLIPFFLALQY